MQSQLGFLHFLQQADGVALAILVFVGLMSISTWYLIASKSLFFTRSQREDRRFLDSFWSAPQMNVVMKRLETDGAGSSSSRLVMRAYKAVEVHRQGQSRGMIHAGSVEDFVTRVIKQGLEEERLRDESGMTWLATVASSAPFIGLFGTVWGIYHALLAIGISGQGTLDKVAGPVGEALIMTAIGLAVAIPAAISYNIFTRTIRRRTARLEAFAHDVLTLMTTGLQFPNEVEPSTSSNVATASHRTAAESTLTEASQGGR